MKQNRLVVAHNFEKQDASHISPDLIDAWIVVVILFLRGTKSSHHISVLVGVKRLTD